MIDKNLNASNKKKEGKGNGNSIISPKSTENSVGNYVSGDEFPSSSSHKFSKNSQNKEEDLN